jgi:fructosamine-3-kinase
LRDFPIHPPAASCATGNLTVYWSTFYGAYSESLPAQGAYKERKKQYEYYKKSFYRNQDTAFVTKLGEVATLKTEASQKRDF